MRVTSKGQVTIPQELRERYAMGPGVEVEIVAADGGVLVRLAAHTSEGSRLVSQLRDRADAGLSAEEILRMTRGGDG